MNLKVIGRAFSKTNRLAPFINARNELNQKKKEIKEIAIKQHPKGLDQKQERILNTRNMPEYLTPAFEVPMEFYSLDHLKKDSKDEVPLNPKLIRVAIIGPPNSGKSSLVNSIMGEKLTSVSKISHTTSENSVYVKSLLSEGVQILLHDTPGLVPNYTKGLRGFKKNQAWNALDDSDVIVLMVDCNRRLDDGIIEILNKLRKKKVNIEKQAIDLKLKDRNVKGLTLKEEDQRVILCLNKIDLCRNKRRLSQIKTELEDFIHFEKVVIMSAETKYGIDILQNYLVEIAEPAEWIYSPKANTLQPEASIIEEMVKNAIYDVSYKEIPHKTQYKLHHLEFRTDGVAFAKIKFTVRTKNQKAILIGIDGTNIKKMRDRIRKDFAERFGIELRIEFSFKTSKTVRIDEEELVGSEETLNKEFIKKKEEYIKNRRAAYLQKKSKDFVKDKYNNENRWEIIRKSMDNEDYAEMIEKSRNNL